MSQSNDAKYDRPRGSSRKKGKSNKTSSLFSFHPNKDQREELKKWTADLDKDLEFLMTFLEDNCLLSVGYKAENASYFALLKDRSVQWDQAASVSVWHTDLPRALLGLTYYLKEVNPEFPKVPPGGVGDFEDF